MTTPLYLFFVGPVSYGYDEYDSFVIVAHDEAQARLEASMQATFQKEEFLNAPVENLGQANNKQEVGVVLGSFNAG